MTDAIQDIKEGFALVPLRLTQAMKHVLDEEDWQWEDLLAAAEAITEKQYDQIVNEPVAQTGLLTNE